MTRRPEPSDLFGGPAIEPPADPVQKRYPRCESFIYTGPKKDMVCRRRARYRVTSKYCGSRCFVCGIHARAWIITALEPI